MHKAAGQAPEKKRIDSAERKLAVFCHLARIRYLIQNPGELGRREIRIEAQSRLGDNGFFRTLVFEFPAVIGGSPILPNNGPVHTLAGIAMPDQRCLTLVGDSDSGDLIQTCAALLQGFLGDTEDRAPYFFGVVLHPARLWIFLGKFLLGTGDDGSLAVEDYCATAARALVDCQQVLSHRSTPTNTGLFSLIF